ncbi:hypothetical protein G3I70_32970, partial [Actinomadura bangladeshensis]|nr:hypothetical protein [Actinomadura bangladeshensis]
MHPLAFRAAVLPAAVAGALAFPACALADPTPHPLISICIDIEIGPGAGQGGSPC